MANSYKPGKWSGSISANITSDGSKTTPTLGDDFDTELANLKSAQSNIKATMQAIRKEVTALKNHSETGKMATTYLTATEKQLKKLEEDMNTAVSKMSSAVSKEQKAEWARFKKILMQWEASQRGQNSGTL